MPMTDPSDALASLQHELDARNSNVQLTRCQHDTRLFFHFDMPAADTKRLSYIRKKGTLVTALVQFIEVEPYEGNPCYMIGYAVPELYRGRGWGKDAVLSALTELRYFAIAKRQSQFYVEAIVGTDNGASQKIATAALGDAVKTVTDSFSGLPAFQYMRLLAAA